MSKGTWSLLAASVGAAAALALAFTNGCNGDRYAYLSPAAKNGYQVYRDYCLLCHVDPVKGAPTGPPIAGSSKELLIAKVLEGRYPEGYTPKRPGTITMPPQPGVKSHIDDLAAFLREVRP